MKFTSWRFLLLNILLVLGLAGNGYSAYHHSGDTDSDLFQTVHPETAGTKLDHCALCHTGGEYEKKPGVFVSLGSCQWCHYSFGYDPENPINDIDTTLNQYGLDFRDYGKNADAFAAIADLDSDSDGFSNREEIEALRYPGDPNDDPAKVEAPFRVYDLDELKMLSSHTQFMVMNTHKSGDFYAQYTGVTVQELLADAGILPSATGIQAMAPDGWSQYHPIEADPDPLLYSVLEAYPQAVYYYDVQADEILNPDGWCDYSAPGCLDYEFGDTINNTDGNKLLLAYERNGDPLEPGELTLSNKLDGEGPFRVVPPQKTPGPPDQSVKSEVQDVIWPFDNDADHNAGFATRSTTIIKVEPLPEGTTDINTLEAGWNYVDEGKIVVYGAIDPMPAVKIKLLELKQIIKEINRSEFKRPQMKAIMKSKCRVLKKLVKKGHITPVKKQLENWFVKKVDGTINGDMPDRNDWILDAEAQKQVYWKLNELIVLLNI